MIPHRIENRILSKVIKINSPVLVKQVIQIMILQLKAVSLVTTLVRLVKVPLKINVQLVSLIENSKKLIQKKGYHPSKKILHQEKKK